MDRVTFEQAPDSHELLIMARGAIIARAESPTMAAWICRAMNAAQSLRAFHWENTQSNALYGGGDIIAFAETLEEARAVVLRDVEKCESLGYRDMLREPYDDDDRAERAAAFDAVQLDIAKEPRVIPAPCAIFINGSE